MSCHFPLWLLILLGCQPSWLYYKPGERVEATVLHYACQSEFKIIFGTRIQVQELVFPLSLSSTSDRWPCPSKDTVTAVLFSKCSFPRLTFLAPGVGVGLVGGRTKLATCSLSLAELHLWMLPPPLCVHFPLMLSRKAKIHPACMERESGTHQKALPQPVLSLGSWPCSPLGPRFLPSPQPYQIPVPQRSFTILSSVLSSLNLLLSSVVCSR